MERLKFLDYSKGFFLVMIMYGHLVSLSYETAFIDWMNSIKVVGFYTVSAYLFTLSKRKISNKDYFIKSFKGIMYPYFLFSCAIFIFDLFFSWIKNGSIEQVFLMDIADTLTFRGIGTLWFLPTFFLANFLFKVFKDSRTSLLIISIPISLLFGLFISYLYFKIHDKSIVNKLLQRVLLVIGKTALAYYFLSASYFLIQYIKDKKVGLKLFLAIIFTLINMVMSINNKQVDLNKFQFGNSPIFFFIGAIIGSFGLILMLEYLSESMSLNFKLIGYIGQHSIVPMAIHNSFAIIMIIRYLVGIKVVEYSLSFFLRSIVGLLLLFYSQVLITRVLTSNRFKLFF